MSLVGDGRSYNGIDLGQGANGRGVIFFGTVNPNTITDTLGTVTDRSVGAVVISGTDRITASRAVVGSIYLQDGVGLWVKTALPNVWQQVTVP